MTALNPNVGNNHSVLSVATWGGVAGMSVVTTPEVPQSAINALAASSPAVARALADYVAAVDAVDTARDTGSNGAAGYALRFTAYTSAARLGARKLPAKPDTEATTVRLLGLWRCLETAVGETRTAARHLDGACLDAASDSRPAAYSAAVESAAIARTAVAEAEALVAAAQDAFSTVLVLDGLSLRSAGYPASQIPQILGDRLTPLGRGHYGNGLPMPLGDAIPAPAFLAALAVPALDAHRASAQAATAARLANARTLETVAMPSGGTP